MSRGKTIHRYYTWNENSEDILNEILMDTDAAVIESFAQQPEEFFVRIHQSYYFIKEVERVFRDNTEMSMIRAFWIVNIVYRSYYKYCKYSCMHAFYEIRNRQIRRDRFELRGRS